MISVFTWREFRYDYFHGESLDMSLYTESLDKKLYMERLDMSLYTESLDKSLYMERDESIYLESR